MRYAILTICLVLLLLNLRASLLVVRADYNTKGQKLAQMALVWLLPFIGAIFTAHIHKIAKKEYSPIEPWRDGGFEYEADWALSHDVYSNDQIPPGTE